MVNKVKRCWGENHFLCYVSCSLGWLVGCYTGKAVSQRERKLLFLCVRHGRENSLSESVPLCGPALLPLHSPSPWLSFVQCCFIYLFIPLLIWSLLLLLLLGLEGIHGFPCSSISHSPRGSSSQPLVHLWWGNKVRCLFLQIVLNKNAPKHISWVCLVPWKRGFEKPLIS